VNCGLLTLVFIVLLIIKLTGASALSWWAVFAPLLIGLAMGVLILLILFVIAVVAIIAEASK